MRHRLYRFPTYPWEMSLLPIGHWSCGCRMCTNHIGRKLTRRRERHQVRMALMQGDWEVPELAGRQREL